MTIKALAFSLFATFGVVACTQAPPPPSSEQMMSMTELDVPPALPAAFGDATPEMLRAALSNDPEAMAAAIPSLGSCHAPFTCGAEFGSCGSWSSFSFCGNSCTKRCCHDAPLCNEPDIGGTVVNERFQVCWNSARTASCTNWQTQSQNVCGC